MESFPVYLYNGARLYLLLEHLNVNILNYSFQIREVSVLMR